MQMRPALGGDLGVRNEEGVFYVSASLSNWPINESKSARRRQTLTPMSATIFAPFNDRSITWHSRLQLRIEWIHCHRNSYAM
jgi:hypothetical protein